jgi:hypothetical protein
MNFLGVLLKYSRMQAAPGIMGKGNRGIGDLGEGEGFTQIPAGVVP